MTIKELKCPICKTILNVPNNQDHKTYMPFCSSRCQKLDLGAWAREDYRVPANEKSASLEITEDEDS